MAKPKWRVWTAEETATARQLMAKRAREAEFMAALGRSKQSAISHLNRLEMKTGRDQSCAVERINVPTEVLTARAKRSQAPVTFTGMILGDPPIGYSALDLRDASGAQA
jgi:hypothetical protein